MYIYIYIYIYMASPCRLRWARTDRRHGRLRPQLNSRFIKGGAVETGCRDLYVVIY